MTSWCHNRTQRLAGTVVVTADVQEKSALRRRAVQEGQTKGSVLELRKQKQRDGDKQKNEENQDVCEKGWFQAGKCLITLNAKEAGAGRAKCH